MNDNENNIESDDVEIVYKMERNPVLKAVLGFGIFIVSAVVILFITGFIMGLLNINPPHLDSQVLKNQWDKTTNQQTSTPPSELEPAKTSDGG